MVYKIFDDISVTHMCCTNYCKWTICAQRKRFLRSVTCCLETLHTTGRTSQSTSANKITWLTMAVFPYARVIDYRCTLCDLHAHGLVCYVIMLKDIMQCANLLCIILYWNKFVGFGLYTLRFEWFRWDFFTFWVICGGSYWGIRWSSISEFRTFSLCNCTRRIAIKIHISGKR
jgi:hypothetical protein